MDLYLSNDDRAEHEALMDDVLGAERTVDDAAVRRYRAGLVDAMNAQRDWARHLLDRAVLDGLRSVLKDRAKREAVAMIDYHGQCVGKTVRIGRRRRDVAGRTTYQQSLIELFSWDELTEWLDMISRQIGALLINKHIADRLLSLRTQFPHTYGPAQACAELGTTVENYLATAVAS